MKKLNILIYYAFMLFMLQPLRVFAEESQEAPKIIKIGIKKGSLNELFVKFTDKRSDSVKYSLKWWSIKIDDKDTTKLYQGTRIVDYTEQNETSVIPAIPGLKFFIKVAALKNGNIKGAWSVTKEYTPKLKNFPKLSINWEFLIRWIIISTIIIYFFIAVIRLLKIKQSSKINNILNIKRMFEITFEGAPFLGIIGTVSGLIFTFENLPKFEQSQRLEYLQGGMRTAMWTTLFGLIFSFISFIIIKYNRKIKK